MRFGSVRQVITLTEAQALDSSPDLIREFRGMTELRGPAEMSSIRSACARQRCGEKKRAFKNWRGAILCAVCGRDAVQAGEVVAEFE